MSYFTCYTKKLLPLVGAYDESTPIHHTSKFPLSRVLHHGLCISAISFCAKNEQHSSLWTETFFSGVIAVVGMERGKDDTRVHTVEDPADKEWRDVTDHVYHLTALFVLYEPTRSCSRSINSNTEADCSNQDKIATTMSDEHPTVATMNTKTK